MNGTITIFMFLYLVRHRRRLLPSSPDDVFESTDSHTARLPSPERTRSIRDTSPRSSTVINSSSSSLTPKSVSRSERGDREPVTERGRNPMRKTRKGDHQSNIAGETQRASRSLSRSRLSNQQPVGTNGIGGKKLEMSNHTRLIPRSVSQSGFRLTMHSIN